jgi:hypothetical protein
LARYFFSAATLRNFLTPRLCRFLFIFAGLNDYVVSFANMKKLLIIFCFVFISSGTFAQYYGNGQSPLYFSITGGGTIAYFQVKSSIASHISNSLEGVGSLGGSLEYRFNDYFSISPSIMLSGKGGQTDGLYVYGPYNVEMSTAYELYYLEESLYFIGHIPVGSQANIFFGTGPYYANSIFGKSQTTDNDPEIDRSVKFGKNGDFKSNDYGVTSLVGFETERGYTFSLNFDLGLLNIRPFNTNNVYNDQIKNRSFYMSVGRSF